METEAKKRKICEDKHKHYKKRRIKDKNEEYGGKCEKEKRHIKQDENEKKKSRKGRGEEEEFEEEKEGRFPAFDAKLLQHSWVNASLF
ncbi:hypothetical protein V1477_020643 [Vespula maculifrons]|uniref:Uncharacterized protein n=1 Tax=Vespula maculifrons TaxID=7453 RepID=A0ABD2AMG8_VESMC